MKFKSRISVSYRVWTAQKRRSFHIWKTTVRNTHRISVIWNTDHKAWNPQALLDRHHATLRIHVKLTLHTTNMHAVWKLTAQVNTTYICKRNYVRTGLRFAPSFAFNVRECSSALYVSPTGYSHEELVQGTQPKKNKKKAMLKASAQHRQIAHTKVLRAAARLRNTHR